MAHFAQIDENNIVQQVIVVHNNELLDENGYEKESKGIQFCESLLGGFWVQTSYNASFRKNFAGIGYTFDRVRQAFISPKPYNSWILNEDTCHWEAPTPMPDDGKMYSWDEKTTSWVEIAMPQ
jgi:hypothetical protein